MPNVKISAAADAGTLLSSDMLPLARSGDTNAYHATMAEISTFAAISVSSGTYGNTGRNLIHNPMFTVAQRGTGPFTTNGVYTLDRWMQQFTLDTQAIRQASLLDADRAQIGDEAAFFALNNQFTGNAGATAVNTLEQRIEKVARLSGKTVTISFWATASVALRLGVNLYQLFGTGGTPSTAVQVLITGASVQLTVGWARYSVTVAIPSVAGKTLGTNGDDFTTVRFYFSSGTNNNQVAGNIGVQSGAVSIWGVQLEVGGAATPLAKRDPADELLLCQRFYQQGQFFLSGWSGAAGIGLSYGRSFPVQMRTTPTITPYSTATSNTSSTSLIASGNDLQVEATAAASGGVVYNGAFTASADL